MSSEAIHTKALIKPKAILRYIEVLFCIISFALIADKGYKIGNHTLHQFANAMAWGIVGFIFALFWICVYALQRLCATQMKVVNLFELICDICLLIWGFFSGIAFAYKIDDLGNGMWKLDGHVASCVFLWFALVLFVISAILDLVACLKPSAQQSAEVVQ